MSLRKFFESSSDNVVECLVISESFENGFENLTNIKDVKEIIKYYKNDGAELDADIEEDSPEGPFADEGYENIWFTDLGKLNPTKTWKYLQANYQDEIDEAIEDM